MLHNKYKYYFEVYSKNLSRAIEGYKKFGDGSSWGFEATSHLAT